MTLDLADFANPDNHARISALNEKIEIPVSKFQGLMRELEAICCQQREFEFPPPPDGVIPMKQRQAA